jgi:hypothetical protein
MNTLPIRIVCAAMRMKDGVVVPGVRHFSPEMRIVLHRMYGDKYHLKVEEQGFVDQFGAFHSREDAWKIARLNGQIIRPTGWEGNAAWQAPERLDENGMLFSENLY